MRAAVILASMAACLAAPSWHIVDSDIATIDMGVAFVSDTVGYTGGVANGAGPEIFKTVNGGVNWTPCPAQFGLDILLLDTDATENSIVVSSVFGELYSDDAGASFLPSTGGGLSQSVRYLGVNGDGGLKFGVTGTYGLAQVQGVGISVDGGKTFKTYDAALSTEARYGAFPSDTTWYVAAGTWPGGADDESDFQTGKWTYTGKSYARRYRGRATPGAGYQAQITRTTDGGATFKSVFNVSDEFYFNGIDCSPTNPLVCCAVGEADSDSPRSGARIHCTQNGGNTWTENFYQAGNSSVGYSLMEIRYASATEVWAVGGELAEFSTAGWFLHSADGGNTWGHSTPPMANYYAVGVSAVDTTHVFAAILDVSTQSSGLAAYE